ncbi:nuclear transport factor 2 family protein [Microbacterium sp. SA39]|uniref:nuclear transport factor 2 family protein n=1 Tax=Microbacterium sp. SA39 TaxID=1263625 RepID=UPI0005F9F288|nr:nuclear transport factor 2 family protein [Microbacterium sp. SA39]KJQ53912.1 SnoaL-like domain protein [Microbacterium sp. SA39]
MTDTTPTAVATTYFDALSRGDMATMIAQFDPAIVWHQPGGHRFSGTHVGIEGVGALLGGMMEASEGTFALTVTGPAMLNGELVAIPVRFSGARVGASMDMSGVDLLTVRDGKIVAVHLFSADATSEDAFWAGPDSR